MSSIGGPFTSVGAVLADIDDPLSETRYGKEERQQKHALRGAKEDLARLLRPKLVPIIQRKASECMAGLRARRIEYRVNKNIDTQLLRQTVEGVIDSLDVHALMGWAELERRRIETFEPERRPSDRELLQHACPVLGVRGFGEIMRPFLRAAFLDPLPEEANSLVEEVCESFAQECMDEFSIPAKGAPIESSTVESATPAEGGTTAKCQCRVS